MCLRYIALLTTLLIHRTNGCNFYPVGEYLRFVRIAEDLKVGDEVLKVEVHPRKNLSVQPVDKEDDAHLFTYRDVNRTHVSVVLAQSLEDLVDSDNPQNVVKFRLGCDFDTGDDLISAYLSVTVYIEDVNDHSPVFLRTPYEVTVDELTPTGLTIFRGIDAFDRDKPNTPNSEIQYAIAAGDERGHFAFDATQRALVLKKPLDYDEGDEEFNIVMSASDHGTPQRTANTTVRVTVQDNDDTPPKFTRDVYKTRIREFYPITGDKIHRELVFEEAIKAVDGDLGLMAAVRYDLVSGNERMTFSLDDTNGTLFLEREIDLESEQGLPGNTFMLQIQAAQIDNPLKTAQARIEIEIIDLNDNLPEFEVDFYNISIVENLPNGFSVLQVMASDRDQGDNGEFTYQLDDSHGAFAIDARSGWLTVRNQTVLDRERHESLKMKVYAKEKNPSAIAHHSDRRRLSKWRRTPATRRKTDKDKTTYIFPDKIAAKTDNIEYFEDVQRSMSFVVVEVTLLDANDNNPRFVPSNTYEFSVNDDAPAGSRIGRVQAIDPDLGRNGVVLYDLQRTSDSTTASPFQLDAQTGLITSTESPIVEGRHALFVEASDQPANPSERRYSLAVVTIDVFDHNRDMEAETPEFSGAPYEFWVGSNVGVGASVGQIRVNDAMDRSRVIYDLLHGYEDGVPFAVEERSGVITVIDELTRYSRPSYEFEATATRERDRVTLTTNATVHVVDVHDERGVLFEGASTPMIFHVKENMAGATIGRLFRVNVSALPRDTAGDIRFIIANQRDIDDHIAIGEDGTIYTQKPLDREKRDVYSLTVIAEFNKGPISGAGIYQVTVRVDDDNDNPPLFESPAYEGTILENSKKGTELNMTEKIRAVDADVGQNAVFAYTLFGEGHDNFSIDVGTGAVRFVGKRLDREEKSTYVLKIVARDKGNLSSDTKLTITVFDVNDNVPRFTHITIPSGENVELIESDDTSPVRIYKERESDGGGSVARVEATPDTKFSVVVDTIGPLFSVPENVTIGSTILKLDAIDADGGPYGRIKFEFVSEIFMPPVAIASDTVDVKRFFLINERHGHVIAARALPPEAEFKLNISALDGGGSSDHISVRFFIKDVNDHFPTFRKSSYSFSVEEARYARRVLGKVDATDLDHGQNANITYRIRNDADDSPFDISPMTGVLSVSGELDREKTDKYTLTVVAEDNGIDERLTSSVAVEVRVLDVNDNPPKFFAFDELAERKRPDSEETPDRESVGSVMTVPVYRARLAENAPAGTTVTRVHANDSDFAGNGNGLVLFSLPQRMDRPNLFAIDSKDGVVTTTGRLDYENRSEHSVTVVASDLGSPGLSSTAMLVLTVTDVPEEDESNDRPVFISRYYELEIEENVNTPVQLLTLNLTEHYERFEMRYFLLHENSDEAKQTFAIDPRNGTLYIVRSPDRERTDTYQIIIRAERQKASRQLPHLIYPVSDDALEGMTEFDAKVVVRIRDVNDNAPEFESNGRPTVTALPTTAAFGYPVIRLQATDADSGLNADVRYQIINDQSQRFAIDPITGHVRAVSSFRRDAGRVFGFDVKATDKRGADDGKSAIANVFVYVLEEGRELVLVMAAPPLAVESRIANITDTLSALSGYDVRVRALRPNARSATDATDVHLYAIDAMSNAIVDSDALRRSLSPHESRFRTGLSSWKVLELGGRPLGPARLGAAQLSALSVAAVVLVGAGVAAVAVLCCRNNRNGHRAYSRRHLDAFAADHLTEYGGASYDRCQQIDRGDETHADVKKRHAAVEEFGKAHQKCIQTQYDNHHDNSCIKFNQRTTNNKRSGLETSLTSLHSSADSGIERCACTDTPHASEESSGCSYEDSLKSNRPRIEFRTEPCRKDDPSGFYRRGSFGHQLVNPAARRHDRGRRSFSENILHRRPRPERIGAAGRMIRQISSPDVSAMRRPPHYLDGEPNRKEEPVVDYDQSDVDEMYDRFGRTAAPPPPQRRRTSKLMEIGGQAAVFVATPTAAEIIRRQGSDRIMFARPL